MKTRNSIRAEINALYRNKVITWLSESVKSKSTVDPVRIYLGAPTKDEDVLKNKDEFLAFCEDWHKELTAGKVDFIEKNYPEIGTIEVPIHLVFDRIEQIATWAGHLVEYHTAEMRLNTLQLKLPELVDAGVENINYLTSLDDADFIRFVDVCRWLCQNRNSGMMIRQIPVRGVDTEWFESHRILILNFLRDYLDLPPMRRDVLQLGLVPPTQPVRAIFLDNVLRSKVGGLRDLGITIRDLNKLDIKPRKVLLFDDLATALSIPDIPGVVILVLTSNIGDICKIPWVARSQVAYVSGVEMRSFAVINNIRVYIPNAVSVTLNKEVFDADKDLWSFDDIEIQELNSSMALTVQESMLYNMLAAGVFGKRARIPQERMPLQQIFDLLDIVYESSENVEPPVVESKSSIDTDFLEKSIVKSTSIDEKPYHEEKTESPIEDEHENASFDDSILGEDNTPEIVESSASMPLALQSDSEEKQ
ncbi:DUF3322 domain-containing protein [Succinivibrio dextrinosolvens]|uniref:DUF3322 domain-containing protein n=1 Tax=Succinivibrio dextrinosolvens TaxID=83771 RepID=UPI0019222D90|nr:DUF3322 domain-containing protein [Succinivibrio dextrinosolvens]